MPRKSIYLQGTDQDPSYSATDDRIVSSSVLSGVPFTTALPGIGQIGRGHGVLSQDSLKVVTDGTNVVTVNSGIAVIRGTQSETQGVYLCPLDADENVTITAAHASLQRLDYIAATVKDQEFPEFTGNVWEINYIEGIPGEGTPSVPKDTLVLAEIVVESGGSTEITSGNVIDLRTQSRAHGTIIPVSNTSAFSDPIENDIVWDRSVEELLIRKSGSWNSIGVNYSSRWKVASGPFHDGTVDGGSGFVQRCEYIEYGRLIIGSYYLKFGSGGKLRDQLVFKPPEPARNIASTMRYIGAGYAHDSSNDTRYAVTCELWPSFDNQLFFNFVTGGTAQWQPGIPFNWSENDELIVWFMYERAA